MNKKYEWAVIGGGIAGITVSEILAREGHSVILIDKNPKLASVTTREFHEWIHTGSLYTLIPDKLKTLKFILGAIDDLIEYYSVYDRMNLVPSKCGLSINTREKGWFEPEYIHFKYRIKGRKITFPWLIGVARSIRLIEKIQKHDWLRRRAGELEPFKENYFSEIFKNIIKLLKYKGKFFDIETPDFTTNSRILIRDLVSTGIMNGLDISLNNRIIEIKQNENNLNIIGEKESFKVKKIAVCAGKGVGGFSDSKMKTSFAPIAIVNGIENVQNSFVELDYFPKNCINMLTKDDGIGLIGGISLSDKDKCDAYLDYVINQHKKYIPNMKVIDRYIGEKNEITFKGEDRNYLYHIHKSSKHDNVWSIIPGKFTLAFSLAPEFYRRIYNKNPRKLFKTSVDDGKYSNLVANTVWWDVKNKLTEK